MEKTVQIDNEIHVLGQFYFLNIYQIQQRIGIKNSSSFMLADICLHLNGFFHCMNFDK